MNNELYFFFFLIGRTAMKTPTIERKATKKKTKKKTI